MEGTYVRPNYYVASVKQMAGGIGATLKKIGVLTGIFSVDITYILLNLIFPKKKVGHVISPGKPGHGGIWPAYVPPKEGDSRSPCPAINALANHGILPHDGKNIPFKVLAQKVQEAYNLSPTLVISVHLAVCQMLERNYATDTLNLSDLSTHNMIEHDASLTRHDFVIQPDQGVPAKDLIGKLLDMAAASPEKKLTRDVVAHALSLRRAHSKAHNSQYTQNSTHQTFAVLNGILMVISTDGRIEDLRPWLIEERFPDGWEPRNRERFGLTSIGLNRAGSQVKVLIQDVSKDKKRA